ncbi:MAG: glycosyltransferase [Treponemataceae bacterium]
MKKRNFLLLYLNTGGGHLAPASVLKRQLEKADPNINVILVNGFGEKKNFSKMLFEDGYHVMCTAFHGLWTVIYETAMHKWAQNLVNHFLTPKTSKYFQKIIIENEITDIISFHFALTPGANEAIKTLGKDINLSCYCTDPFNGPAAWFYTPNIKTYVASDKMKDFAVNYCNFNPDFIKPAPFLINEKFTEEISHEELKKLREKYSISEGKKVLLMVGGGEGLPKATRIINDFIFKKVKFTIIVVCGRNLTRMRNLEVIKSVNPNIDLRVYGFVNFMDELLKICDMAVIKAGASTILEVCKMKKPAIISSFIHGQEKGNMEFVVENNAGFFIKSPLKIAGKVISLFNNEEEFSRIKANCAALPINTDYSELIKDLLED